MPIARLSSPRLSGCLAGILLANLGVNTARAQFVTEREVRVRMVEAQIAELAVQRDIEGPVDLVPAQRRVSDAQMNSQIRATLQKPKTGDPAKWHDTAEDALVAIGEPGLNLMRTELAQRTGPEADALEAAIFRITHPDLEVRSALQAWGIKHFNLDKSAADPASLLKLTHIAGMPPIFPHHTFYVVEQSGKPGGAVVALAEDGKVQSVEDDAALLKMLQREAEFDPETPPAKTHASLALAAATLGLYRTTLPKQFNPPQAHPQQTTPFDPKVSICEVQGDGAKVTATVNFNDKGAVTRIALEAAKTADVEPVVETAPAVPPPPPLLRGRRGGVAVPPPPVDVQEEEPMAPIIRH